MTKRTFTPGPQSTFKGAIVVTENTDGTRTMTDASGRTWPLANAEFARIQRYMIESEYMGEDLIAEGARLGAKIVRDLQEAGETFVTFPKKEVAA